MKAPMYSIYIGKGNNA